MIHNDKYLGGFPRYTSQLGLILREKYLPKNQPMSIAIVIGAEPLSHMVSSITYPKGISELEMAGALRGEPVPLVKCETNDLLVPADAEMIIEGEILTDHIVAEGPFGEFPGYRSGEMGFGVACRVNAITHRKDPIITVSCVGPKDETSMVTSLGAALTIKRRLQKQGILLTDVYVPREGAVHLAIVGVKQGGKQVVQKILELLTARRADISKIIVVDEDIDVFNMEEVIHAFATKCHPGQGIIVTQYEGKAQILTPAYSQEERMRLKGASVAFDATWPPEWSKEAEVPVKASFSSIYPKEVQDMALSKWKRYLGGKQ